MAFTKLTTDVENITPLDPEPNDVGGLSAAELQALFDKAGVDIKQFINDTLIAELEKVTAGSSGAQNIGCETLLTKNNVMDILKAIVAAGTGSVPPDGSITNAKLDSDVKIGSLVTSTTTEKGSIIGITNEINAKIPVGSIVTTAAEQTLTNKTLTSPVLNTGVSGTAIDTDISLAGNSDTKLTSQKATKAYVDNTAILKSIIDAAGDLIIGTADNTAGRLGKGNDGQILNLVSGLPAWVDKFSTAKGNGYDNSTSVPNGYYTKTIALGVTPKLLFATLYDATNSVKILNFILSQSAEFSFLGYAGSSNYMTSGLQPNNTYIGGNDHWCPWFISTGSHSFESIDLSGSDLIVNLRNTSGANANLTMGWNWFAIY